MLRLCNEIKVNYIISNINITIEKGGERKRKISL